jgi:predicted transcriptional regulator
MTVEKVRVSLVLPRDLWEQLLGRAQAEQKDETTLMIRAIEQFLQREAARIAMAERLQRECEELAMMEFDDVGTEDEWLIIQNEALNKAEVDLA